MRGEHMLDQERAKIPISVSLAAEVIAYTPLG